MSQTATFLLTLSPPGAKNAPPPGSHTINMASRVLTRVYWRPCFQPTGTILEFVRDIIGTNLLTKFHDDQTINVASRVPYKGKMPCPLAAMFFNQLKPNWNLLTKFHEDRTIKVTSSVLTRQMLTPYDGQKAITKAHHEHIVLR
ncbi:hypothetical protein DPMN_010786 [Dreissena polymorpha]|uniref:Uncharacterized protein n=1 Tax=Dreissena polymorpha TaxID=45954 RepID=A0A9D4MZC6_DREPO|nr:hypothetical protein DPMN_010786 [Dreissena polymorpha]